MIHRVVKHPMKRLSAFQVGEDISSPFISDTVCLRHYLSSLQTEGDIVRRCKTFFFVLAANEMLGQPLLLLSEKPDH